MILCQAGDLLCQPGQDGDLDGYVPPADCNDINPSVYLTDVLQRVATHPNADIDQLTPRLWKTHFADNPLRSDLER